MVYLSQTFAQLKYLNSFVNDSLKLVKKIYGLWCETDEILNPC